MRAVPALSLTSLGSAMLLRWYADAHRCPPRSPFLPFARSWPATNRLPSSAPPAATCGCSRICLAFCARTARTWRPRCWRCSLPPVRCSGLGEVVVIYDHLNGAITVQDAGEHGHALFGEGVRRVTSAALT